MPRLFGSQMMLFAQARRSLMLPFPRGKQQAIADALHCCDEALGTFDDEQVADGGFLRRVGEMKVMLDVGSAAGCDAPVEPRRFLAKAQSMSPDQELQLSTAVDVLASWFAREFYSSHSMAA